MEKKTYQPIIGLEVHVELKTNSKMFCGCSADYFGHQPNTHCCPVCLGLPGSLPVPNKRAVEWTVMAGLALNCKIPLFSKFDRKNYFYPDLPKGYQISQYDKPFATQGSLKLKIKNEKLKMKNTNEISKNIKEEIREIGITRVHLEEDTGKLIHATINGKKCTLIDFNRSGVPLMEVVTEPDIRSGEEAKIFLQKLQQLLRYLGVSDCDMEKGSMRCEPNISIRKSSPKYASFSPPPSEESPLCGATSEVKFLPDYKVEIKNLNSFKFVKKAIDYEIDRQIKIFQKGGRIDQETRGWDEKKNITLPQRGKETAADYRYFPEPDVPPIRWTKTQIAKIKARIPELPDQKFSRFIKKYNLSEYNAKILTSKREIADYYEEACCAARGITNYKLLITNKKIANWIINKKVDVDKVLPAELIEIILKKHAPSTVGSDELKKIVVQVLLDNTGTVNDYKKGKTQALMYLVGQVMSHTKGQADPKMTEEILKSKIDSDPPAGGHNDSYF